MARRVTIDRVLFQGNRSTSGGAVYLQNAKPLEILATTFTGNVAARGGGAGQLVSSQLNLVNSTFNANVASAGIGGALMLGTMDSTGSIRNATFANNRSTGGSGMFAAALSGSLNFPVYNTLFANNTTADAGSPMQCWFAPATGSANLQWPRNRVTGGAADTACVNGIAWADPKLGALAANGGPTPTLSPAADSPMRGAGRNCPATDQRGARRNTTACTIGAVE